MLKHSMAAAGLLILATGAAMAQTVVITPEQETIVREYVVRQHVEPIPPPPDFDLTVGSIVPDVVEVRPLDVPEVQYEYFILDGHTVLVMLHSLVKRAALAEERNSCRQESLTMPLN